MVANLNTLVQKIVVQADTKGVDSLNNALSKLKSQARSVANSFSKMMTPEQRIALAKANEIITHNNARIAEAKALTQQHNAVISQNNAIISQNTKERVINTNAYMQATQATQLKLSADKRDIQLSKERVAELRKETAERRNATNAIKTQSSAMLGLKSLLGYFVGIHTVFSFFRTAREIDLLQSSLKGLTGSTQDFEYLTQEAFRTATAIEDISQSYKGFYAAANMSGFSKGQIQEQFSSLLTGLRGAGLKQTPIKFALLAIEQMYSKGKIQAEELRRQLANALPGAFEIMASAANVTTAELSEMMKKGLLPANKYVPLLIKEIERYYKTGFVENVKSLDAAFLNLHNATVLLVDSMMKTDMSKGLIEGIKSLSDLLKDKSFISLLAQLGNFLGLIFSLISKILKFTADNLPIIITLLGAAGLAGAITKILQIIISLRTEILTLAAAMNISFGAAMIIKIRRLGRALTGALLTPFTKIALTIASLITLFIVLQDLYYGLFKRKEYKSITGDIIEGRILKESFGGSANGGIPRTKNVGQRMQDFERLKETPMIMTNPNTIPIRNNAYDDLYFGGGGVNLEKNNNVTVNTVNIYESENGRVTWNNIVDSFENV